MDCVRFQVWESNNSNIGELPMIKKPKLKFVERPSPNFNSRNGASVIFLVLHYTAMDTAEAAIERLCDPKSEVSSHYVIDEKGAIYRLVDEENRAWHAGVSFWDVKTDLNTTSIGIEIANPGNIPFPKEQMDAVISLSRDIVNRYKIKASYVVAHSDIAPDRKQDPGELFDWQGLSAFNLGVWPQPASVDYNTSKNWAQTDVQTAIAKLGFRPTVDYKDLVTAFQRHWEQEVFKTQNNVGTADVEMNARLACLVRRKAISDGVRMRLTRKSKGAA
jgi:N-acetylmuramoyl-L-alanine amidase